MNRNNKTLFLALLAGAILLSTVAGWAQQPKPKAQKQQQVVQPETDQEYSEEEYDAYEKATQEADLDKRATMLTAFMEKYPKSKLMSYIVTAYQTLMYEHQKNQRYAKLLPLAEEWLKTHPDDMTTIAYIAESAQLLGQDKKFIEYGQRIYAQKPSSQLVSYIAQSYEKIGDPAKHLEWIEKLYAYPEYNDNFNIRMVFVKKFADEKNYTKAASYSREALKALDLAKKPESRSSLEWCKETTAVRRVTHYLIGISQYEQQKYAEAIKSMQAALRVEKFDTAHYYIGLSQWKLDKIEEAMMSFAKTVQLKGESAGQAKEHLEKLYKALHNNLTIGIDKVYRKADTELAAERVPECK